MSATETQQQPWFLGCPVWASPQWVGSLYASSDRRKWLRDYSAVFNTVEGNSTFYGLPAADVIQRWGESTADGFRFALKFPREISHDCELVQAQGQTAEFLQVLDQLDRLDRLGPSFLQLSPRFSGRNFIALASYLKRLPKEFPYALEVRHADYYTQPLEKELDDLLAEFGIDRVLFDSRPLFSKEPSDEYEQQSQARKPLLPHRVTVTSGRPMLRLVGRNDVSESLPWIREWAPVIAGWIAEGLTPFVFTHSPNDAHAPEFAERLHEEVRQHTELVPPLQAWPGRTAGSPRQQSLF